MDGTLTLCRARFTIKLTLSPTNLLPTVPYFPFLYVSSSSVKTPLSSQVGNLVFIPAFNVFSSVLSIVFFLRASYCFPAAVKTRSIPPPDPGQPSYGPFYHILSNVPTNFYYRITGDSKERNTVLPPVRQLNVSVLLSTDLTEVYC